MLRPELFRSRRGRLAGRALCVLAASMPLVADAAAWSTEGPAGTADDVFVIELGEAELEMPFGEILANDGRSRSSLVAMSPPSHGTLSTLQSSFRYAPGAALLNHGLDSFRYAPAAAPDDQATVFVLPESAALPLHIDDFEQPIFEPGEDWVVVGDPDAVSANGADPIDGDYDLLLDGGPQPLWIISIHAKGGGTTTGSKTGFDVDPGFSELPAGRFTLATALDDRLDAVWEIELQTSDGETTVRALCRDGQGGVVATPPVILFDGARPERLSLYWWSASSEGLRDGMMLLFLGDRLVSSVGGIGWNQRPLSEFLYGIGNSSLIPPVGSPNHTGTSLHLDNLGLWKEVEVPGRLPLFADGVESGGLDAWDLVHDPAGALLASQAAALAGSWGLEARFNASSAQAFVETELAQPRIHLRSRFLFETRDLQPGLAPLVIFEAFTPNLKGSHLQLLLRRESAEAVLEVRARDAAFLWHVTEPVTVQPGAMQVEIQWWQSPPGKAGDGGLRVWIDRTEVADLRLDTSTLTLDSVRFGALAGQAQTRGSLYLDEVQLFW